MRATVARFLTGTSYVAIALVTIQAAVMVGVQAYQDYGWLGVLVIVAVGGPFFWLLPLVGWWFLPFWQMVWLFVFLGAFLASAAGASALEKSIRAH